jgi:putative methyltransferase (TIGR04325 family)
MILEKIKVIRNAVIIIISKSPKKLLKKVSSFLKPSTLIARLRDRPRLNITYEGTFDSFEEVRVKYGSRSDYLTNIGHKGAIADTHNLIRQFNNSFILPSWPAHRINILASYISGLGCGSIKILDIGGGFAEAYLHIKSSNSLKLDYRILELEHTVDACKDIFEDFYDLKFYSDIKELEFDPDIVYFGSSLQYFENWKEFLHSLQRLNAATFIITDTPMGNIDTFVTAQINLPGNGIPRYIFSIDEVKSLFFSLGYILVHDSSIYDPSHNFENFPEKYWQITNRNLIFTRENN